MPVIPVIQSIEPIDRPASPNGGARTIARFTVDIGGVRLFGLLLRRKPDGTLRIAAPNLAGQHSATFEKHLSEKITTAAVSALKGGHIARNENRN